MIKRKFGQRFKTISSKHRVALLLTAASATLLCSHIGYSAPVTLGENDKPVWEEGGITINGATASKLTEISSNADVSTSVSEAAKNLKTLIDTYVTTPDEANKTNFEGAVKAYNGTIATAQGSGASANGLPTIVFNNDTPLAATAGTADQRFGIAASKIASFNIADGTTLTISGGKLPARTNGMLNIASQGVFAQTGNGALVFSDNTATNGNYDMGAAIYNMGVASFDGAVSFINNRSITAGAIFNSGMLLFNGDANFKGNQSERNGGAVINGGVMVFGGKATFESNTANYVAGIYNGQTGTIVFNSDAIFNNNTATYFNVGALQNDGKVVFAGKTTFDGNHAETDAGAIYNSNTGVIYFKGDTLFNNNDSAKGIGGAIYNLGGTVIFSDNAAFENNKANRSYSGAIYSSGVLTLGDNATFKGNFGPQSGAISNTINGGSRGVVTIGDNATFENNKGGFGGAIVNFFQATIGTGATFINNVTDSNLNNETSSANENTGSAIENVGEFTIGSGARFINNKSTSSRGSGGAIDIGRSGTMTLLTDANGKATQFFGNTHNSKPGSIYLNGGTLNVKGNGIIDMLDPMARNKEGSVTVNQTGGGTWYLAGTSNFSPDGADNTNFSVIGSHLYLYGKGETSKSGAKDSEGNSVIASVGVIKLVGANSSFTLGSDSILTSGGTGNAIQVKDGTITFADNTKLNFNLANYDRSSTSPMLMLDAAHITLGDNLIFNLTSAVSTKGDYKLLTVSQNGILDNNKITLTAAGQFIDDVDFLQGTKGWVDGNDYIVSFHDYTWNSTLVSTANNKMSAFGDFTVASGDFTIDDAFADRNDLNATNNDRDWDGKSLTKKGAGTLILNGANTYTGLTSVKEGSLIIGGDFDHQKAQIAGNINVASGATLGGHGTVFGDVQLASGSTISPGSSGASSDQSLGTLTAGSVHFGAGSTYWFETDYTSAADKIIATSANGGSGIVTIDHGAILAINGLGSNKKNDEQTYTIIDTNNGVNGQFDQVINNLAFFDYTVSYTDNQVNLILKRNKEKFVTIAGSSNQRNVGRTLASLPRDSVIYESIIGLTKDQVLPVYDNLSGEIYGSTRSVLMMNSRYLRDAVNRRMLSETRMPSTEPVWFATWGHGGDINGNSNAAKVDNKGWGIALGADGEFTENIFAGLVLGYERTEIDGKGRSSNSDIDAFHIGGYAATEINTIKLRGGLAYSYLDTDIERDIWVDGLQGKAKSDPNGWQFQIFGEASKDFQVSDKTTLSPYANIAHVWLNLDDASEHGSRAALDIDGGTDETTFTTLGLRGEIKLPTTTQISLYGDLGWQHAFGDTDGKTRNRFRGVGDGFTIKGIGVDEDAALIGVGLNIAINDKNSVVLGYQGQIGSDLSDHSANVMWKVKF